MSNSRCSCVLLRFVLVIVREALEPRPVFDGRLPRASDDSFEGGASARMGSSRECPSLRFVAFLSWGRTAVARHRECVHGLDLFRFCFCLGLLLCHPNFDMILVYHVLCRAERLRSTFEGMGALCRI